MPGKPAGGRPRPNARGRSNGRVTHQERQKQDSRDRLIAAARDVLEELPYALVAVEDIIARAEVSRATFYRHFASKFAVGTALHDEFWPRLFELYSGLAGKQELTEQDFAQWIRTILGFYRQERTLVSAFRQMMTIEPEFAPIMDRISGQVIEVFAGSSPVLARLVENSPAGRMARVDARLLLSQLDDFCYAAAFHTWMEDVEDGVRVVARNFRRFVEDLCHTDSPTPKRSATGRSVDAVTAGQRKRRTARTT